MIRFKYCGTHIKDEEYMNKMSTKGWNTKSLTEGFWKEEEQLALCNKIRKAMIIAIIECPLVIAICMFVFNDRIY